MGIFSRQQPEAAQSSAPLSPGEPRPTVVIVHGAFADSTAFGEVAAQLLEQGFAVRSVATPLRDLDTDAAYVHSILASVDGPVVLVGHSYAGSVITQAAADSDNVEALVYVAAFIPRAGESSGGLNGTYPGSLLTPDNLIALATPDGHTDLYIKPEKYEEVYAAGLTPQQLRIAAFSQRPVTAEALGGVVTKVPTRDLPAWQIVATRDNAVPPELQRFLAERAGATVIEADCGHAVAPARPQVVVEAVLAAAKTVG